MKKRIRSGQYEFPKPEWTKVSDECKNLIKMCLKTDPDERPNIDQVIQSPWISVRVKENLFSFESLKQKVRVRA